MGYYGSLAILGSLIPLAVLGGIVFLVIYLVKHRGNGTPALIWKRFGVATSISFVLPFFIGFSTSSLFENLNNTPAFITMIAMAVIFFIIGLIIGHHTVISASLIIGSIITLIYAIGLNIETVPPEVMAILAGLALALLIYVAYKRLQDHDESDNVAQKEVK